jgi:hypothetical protein
VQPEGQLLALKQGLIAKYGEEGYYALLCGSNVFKRLYRNDRVAFVHDCFNWLHGKAPTDYQLDIIGMADAGADRIATPSLHGVGKTTIMSWFTLHFALTRDGEDWKGIATASAWRQLQLYYFPEVKKWSRLLKWDKVGRRPFNERTELQKLNLALLTGAFSCVASDNPGLIEGAHADKLIYLFDESKLVAAATFDAAEGAFSNSGVGGAEAFAFAASTPGTPSGRFYDICRHAPGLQNWKVRPISLDDAIKAKRVSPRWVEDMAKLWGETSPIYRNKVKGEFAAQDEMSVIPLTWVEAAVDRYKQLAKEGLLTREALPPLTGVGADIGDGGADPTVLAPRYGHVIHNIDGWPSKQNEQVSTAQRIGAIINLHEATETAQAVVDGIGVGSGVVSYLEAQKYLTVSFIASAGTDVKDASGKFGFLNLRALAWWNMRELLNPENGGNIALPPIEELIGELTTPKWMEVAGAKIKVESKEDIRKRNEGRSTDYADAVIMIFCLEHLGWKRAKSW